MKTPTHTLVVDDEEGIRFFLEETLGRAGHTVAKAASGEEALERLREDRFDLMMLDLKLGGRVDGLKVLEAVKWRWPETVVVILTAHGSLESAMAAIREGVDGYLLKPVEPDEVRRAVGEAMERREREAELQQTREEKSLAHGPFRVDPAKHEIAMDGEPLDLTPHEFKLMSHLVGSGPKVSSPRELVEAMQGFQPDSLHEARQIVKWYIHRLRRKVEPDPSDPRHILNLRGIGYRLSG